MHQIGADCMAPDDSKVPLAAIDDVLVEPVSMRMDIKGCADPVQRSQQCSVRLKHTLWQCVLDWMAAHA